MKTVLLIAATAMIGLLGMKVANAAPCGSDASRCYDISLGANTNPAGIKFSNGKTHITVNANLSPNADANTNVSFQVYSPAGQWVNCHLNLVGWMGKIYWGDFHVDSAKISGAPSCGVVVAHYTNINTPVGNVCYEIDWYGPCAITIDPS